MKFPLAFFLAIIPCMASIAIAGALAFKGHDGWGWFLFVGVLFACGSVKCDDKKDGEPSA